jgi:hypothetical protein
MRQGMLFRKMHIALDGQHFVGCTFEHCSMVYFGGDPPRIEGGTIENCRWELAGAAKQTVQFLVMMRELGAPEIAEQVIDQIRHGRLSAMPAQPK